MYSGVERTTTNRMRTGDPQTKWLAVLDPLLPEQNLWLYHVLLAASRRLSDFYMGPTLDMARHFPAVSAVACIEELARRLGPFLPGRATDHLPSLQVDDIVDAAGVRRPPVLDGRRRQIGAALRSSDSTSFS